MPIPASKYRAPITLLLQATGASSPTWQVPFHFFAIRASDFLLVFIGAKLARSGTNPESITPTITPSPALSTPPACCQAPPLPDRPRYRGVSTVSSRCSSLGSTLFTPDVLASLVASSCDIRAENPAYV